MVIKTFLVEDRLDISSTLIEGMEALASVRFVGLAEDEASARTWLASNDGEWDLAIVDLYLASGSGFGVLKDCQGRAAQQKVVVLTSYALDNVLQRCRELGADAVFDKLQDVEELVNFCRLHAKHLGSMQQTGLISDQIPGIPLHQTSGMGLLEQTSGMVQLQYAATKA